MKPIWGFSVFGVGVAMLAFSLTWHPKKPGDVMHAGADEQHRSEATRAAIREVFARNSEIRKKSLRIMHVSTNLDSKAFYEGLKQVSTKDCPEEFRLAWFDYVEARRLWAEYDLLSLARDGMQVAAASVEPSSFTDVSRRWDKKDARHFFEVCRRVALKYGVDIPAL
jgi:hypothetical protein